MHAGFTLDEGDYVKAVRLFKVREVTFLSVNGLKAIFMNRKSQNGVSAISACHLI